MYLLLCCPISLLFNTDIFLLKWRISFHSHSKYYVRHISSLTNLFCHKCPKIKQESNSAQCSGQLRPRRLWYWEWILYEAWILMISGGPRPAACEWVSCSRTRVSLVRPVGCSSPSQTDESKWSLGTRADALCSGRQGRRRGTALHDKYMAGFGFQRLAFQTQ